MGEVQWSPYGLGGGQKSIAFEPSNSSYRSRWFCVVKKDGKALRPVLSLEPLNQVTIQHSGVLPFTEQLVEHFASRACGSMLDLYVGYDERALTESSRDYTTFQSPFGALCLTTLPMGWTNSVPIFHDDVTFILQAETPHITIPYIDDVPVRGPAERYILPSGEPETIPENSGIRRFIWEHFQDLNRVVQRMKYSGGTFSGVKAYLAAPEITVLGHRCTIDGRLPDLSRMEKIVNWGPCRDLSDVHAFLGTIGVCRLFIRNFTQQAHHLVKLTQKGTKWEFGQKQIDAMNNLKDALLNSPALRPINYKSEAPVILSVDTSHIAVGYLLAQCDPKNPRLRYYARFGSIMLNDRESRFSQAKLELYGLYHTLRALKPLLMSTLHSPTYSARTPLRLFGLHSDSTWTFRTPLRLHSDSTRTFRNFFWQRFLPIFIIFLAQSERHVVVHDLCTMSESCCSHCRSYLIKDGPKTF